MKNILFVLVFLLLHSCSSMQSVSSWVDENSETDTVIEDEERSIYNWLSPDLSSDSIIYLANPSFEKGLPGHSLVPFDWLNCNEFNESPPDIHSSDQGHFGVENSASHGTHFLGLVMRDNNTFESIAQKLYFDLVKDETYKVHLDIASSDKLKSLSKTTMKEEYFTEPGVLRIWIGNDRGDKADLIYTSPLINHSTWKTYTVEFTAPANVSYFILEAHYEDAFFVRNGNILIDNISPIYKINK